MIPPYIKLKSIKRNPIILDDDLVERAAGKTNVPKGVIKRVENGRLILTAKHVRVGMQIINPLNPKAVETIKQRFRENVRSELRS